MRRFPCFALLVASAASAQSVNFEFVAPLGAGNRVADGGTAVLEWVDGPDSADVARVSLYAVPGGISPVAAIAAGALLPITPGPLHINDPANAYDWSTEGLSPGCYQPLAILTDPSGGAPRLIPAPGVFSVGTTNALPPSIWIVSPADTPVDAQGLLRLNVLIDDPQGDATVEFSFVQLGVETPIGDSFVATAGTNQVFFSINTARAPIGVSFVRARITAWAGPAAACDAYWQGLVRITPPDGGELPIDGDVGDGGFLGPGLGIGASGPPLWGGGGACGCGSITGATTGLLAWLLLRPRRATGRKSPPAAVCL